MNTLGSLGKSDQKLENLAQTARQQHLTQAKSTLIVIGILTILINGYYFYTAESDLRDEINKSGVALNVSFQAAVLSVRLVYGGTIALGIVFAILGFLVPKFPVPATIIGLVLYIGATAIFAMIDMSTLMSGFVIKAVIIVSLFKAVNAALAYQKQSDKANAEAASAPNA
jgi:hypothetical protein